MVAVRDRARGDDPAHADTVLAVDPGPDEGFDGRPDGVGHEHAVDRVADRDAVEEHAGNGPRAAAEERDPEVVPVRRAEDAVGEESDPTVAQPADGRRDRMALQSFDVA